MRRLAAVCALVFLGACTNEIDESTRPENIVGDYQLVSYGGAPLPATRQLDTATALIISGELILTSDHSWTETVKLRTSSGAGQLLVENGSGSWAIIRDFAYLAFSDIRNGYQFSGTAAGRTIVLQNSDGTEMVYRR
ncbi:MAG: hypothetical protein ABI625_09295 [bacterium]